MIKNNTFIGIVTDVIDEHSFIFRSDNNVKCQIGQIVGLKNVSQNIYTLACISQVNVAYFLTNSEEYFTSIASENKLNELLDGVRSPKYSQRITANFIGIYEYSSDDKHFIESSFSIDSYTPSIFQEVVSFDFNCIETVYGLKQNLESYFKLGKFLYPNYSNKGILPDVNISTNTFNSHTLISGVTGSGKSRLTALIANQLSSNGGHITIIDPHNEYANIVDTRQKVCFLSNSRSYKKNSNNQYEVTFLYPENIHKRDDIIKRSLSLTNQHLTPTIIGKLLPELTKQQVDYIYEVFDKITSQPNYSAQNLRISTILESMLEDFKLEFRIKYDNKQSKHRSQSTTEEEQSPLQKASEFADKDSNDYYNRYLLYLAKDVDNMSMGKLHVIYAVLKKILKVNKEDIFPERTNSPTPSWLDINNRNIINIINLDYNSNDYIRRFLNTIIQCFLIPQENKEGHYRTLIVDEAHLLLNEKSDTSSLLSRLLRESRKFGLSIMFITQNEVDVPEEIKSQFQNKFKFREEKDQILKYLDNQTCICSIYKGKLSFPMRVDNVEGIRS